MERNWRPAKKRIRILSKCIRRSFVSDQIDNTQSTNYAAPHHQQINDEKFNGLERREYIDNIPLHDSEIAVEHKFTQRQHIGVFFPQDDSGSGKGQTEKPARENGRGVKADRRYSCVLFTEDKDQTQHRQNKTGRQGKQNRPIQQEGAPKLIPLEDLVIAATRDVRYLAGTELEGIQGDIPKYKHRDLNSDNDNS